MTLTTPSYNRADHIDQLRGLAVIGMIVAHALYFFHNGDSGTLIGLARMLNTFVLTFFVFISGLAASRTLDMAAHIPTRHLMWPTVKRIGLLYMTYCIIVCVQIGTNATGLSLEHIREQLFGAITLQSPPSFTEFLPLFILIIAISLPLRNLYRVSRKSLRITMMVCAGLYMLGLALYFQQIPVYLTGIKALLSGHESLLRFPLLFYLPIYFTGVWWQYQADHNTTPIIRHQKIGIIVVTTCVVFIGIIVGRLHENSMLDPLTRWPPSVSFLAGGLLFSTCIYILQPILNTLTSTKKILEYMGRDALDMFLHHLILLFFYRAIFGVQFGTVPQVFTATILLLVATTMLSSIAFTNKVSLPLHIRTHKRLRLRKRYIAVIILMSICVTWNVLLPKNISPYGNFFNKTTETKVFLPKTTTIYISTNRKWYTHRVPKTDQIELSAQVIDMTTGLPIHMSPDSMTIYMEGQSLPISGHAQNNGVIVYIIPTNQIPLGSHTLSARIRQGALSQINSNNVTIQITEPVLVAWTFDWEGWTPPQEALSSIETLAKTYAPIPFTHFVHPRMFMPSISTTDQIQNTQNFLKNRELEGDEIALHLHMQYDFVTASGVIPKRTNPWGLRTNEGYDIPITEYSPSEFSAMIDFGLSLLADAGFTNIRGFRAGGWFINEQQLDIVKNAGFMYDSSGRSKPTSGAFQKTPWDLPKDVQPYKLNISDQNNRNSFDGLLEIPNNALTTYDQSTNELIEHANIANIESPNLLPKTLIYVSHPQFYSREFGKISPVLNYLHAASLENDAGPVVFSTMSDIAKLWTSTNF